MHSGKTPARDMVKAVADLQAAQKRMKKSELAQVVTRRQSADVIPLPGYADDKRVMLNDLLRSSLFTCGLSNERVDHKQTVIAAVDHITLKYTGEELRQKDLDNYMALLHLGRGKDANGWFYFSPYSVLKSVKASIGGDGYLSLRDSIRRMQACSIEVESRHSQGKHCYGGPLIAEFMTHDLGEDSSHESRWGIKINPRIAAMFAPGRWSQIDWETRLKLGPLAKWLHAFYSTNRAPYPYGCEKLMKLSGSGARTKFHFRAALKKALDHLVKVGFLEAYEFHKSNDTVSVRRRQALAALASA